MKKKGLFSEVFSLVKGNSFSLFLQVIIGLIVVNKLGPEGNGIYSAVLIVPMLAGTIAKLGVRRSVIYHIGQKIFSEKEIVSALFYLLIFISGVWILITWTSFYFLENRDLYTNYIPVVLAGIPFTLTIKFALGIFIGKRKMKDFVVFQWLPDLLELILIVVFVIFLKLDVFRALLAILISNIILSIVAVIKVKQITGIYFEYHPAIMRKILGLGIVFALALLVLKLHYRIDILLLERLSTIREVGFYSLAARFAQKWQIPFTAGAVIVSRSANARNMEKLTGNIQKLMRLSLLGGTLATAGLYFLSPYVIPLLYGHKFDGSIPMIQAILPGILVLVVSGTLSNYFAGQGKALIILVINLASLILNIALNLVWIPKWGGIGAAMATNVSYLFCSVLALILYSRLTKNPVGEILFFKKSDFDFLKNLKETLRLSKNRQEEFPNHEL